MTFLSKSGPLNEYSSSGERSKPRIQECAHCGTPVRTARIGNGEIVVTEARNGLRGIKHACFYPGLGYPKTRDPNTGDLFEGEKH